MSIIMSCREAARLHSQSLDVELSFWQRMFLNFHLLYCRACARYVRQVAFVRVATRRLFCRVDEGSLDGVEQLSDEAKTRMKDAVQRSLTP